MNVVHQRRGCSLAPRAGHLQGHHETGRDMGAATCAGISTTAHPAAASQPASFPPSAQPQVSSGSGLLSTVGVGDTLALARYYLWGTGRCVHAGGCCGAGWLRQLCRGMAAQAPPGQHRLTPSTAPHRTAAGCTAAHCSSWRAPCPEPSLYPGLSFAQRANRDPGRLDRLECVGSDQRGKRDRVWPAGGELAGRNGVCHCPYLQLHLPVGCYHCGILAG